MRRVFRPGFAFLAAAVLCLLVPAGSAVAQAPARFHVAVYHGGVPVPDIAVIINSSASDPRGYINSHAPNRTDANGEFYLDLPPGTYDVHVAEPLTNNATYPSQVFYEVTVGPGVQADVPFELARRTGAITGWVRHPSGAPAAGVKVEAFGTDAVGDPAPFGWGDVRTDANGVFTLGNLLPNRYYVVFVSELGYRLDGVPVQAGAYTPDLLFPGSGAYVGRGPIPVT